MMKFIRKAVYICTLMDKEDTVLLPSPKQIISVSNKTSDVSVVFPKRQWADSH